MKHFTRVSTLWRRRVQRHEYEHFIGGLVRAGSNVHADAFLHPDSVIKSVVQIGRGSRINGPAVVRGKGSLTIGQWSAIGEELRVITSNHDMKGANVQRKLHLSLGLGDAAEADDVTIGDATWVGDRVLLLPGARLSPGVVVAAGTVVARGPLPAFSVVAGVPARVIKPRFSPAVTALLMELRWWEWEVERIRRNTAFMEADLTTIDVDDLRTLVRD